MTQLVMILTAIPIFCAMVIIAQAGYDVYGDYAQLKRYKALVDSVENPDILTVEDYARADIRYTTQLYDRMQLESALCQTLRDYTNTCLPVMVLAFANAVFVDLMIRQGPKFPVVGLIGLNLGVYAIIWWLILVFRFNHNLRRIDCDSRKEIVKTATVITLAIAVGIIGITLILTFGRYASVSAGEYIQSILGG